MATHIVAPAVDALPCTVNPPHIETVLLWLTLTIERDYVARGVFPTLRAGVAVSSRANATLHYLTCEMAQALLLDAEKRCEIMRKGMKVAYNAHVTNLKAAIDEASGRRAKFEATEPACTYCGNWSEYWRGTKEQLHSLGLITARPYPGEPGGNGRSVLTKDRRGYTARITRASTIWPGLFEVNIKIPKEVRQQREDETKQAKAESDRIQRLKTMPDTTEKFRADVADTFWRWVTITKSQMRQKDGFRFTEDAVQEFLEAASDTYWTIKEGATTGSSPRERLQQVLCAKAKADAPLQRFLSSVRPGEAN